MSIKKSKFQNFSKLLWFFRRKKFEMSFIFRIKLNGFLHTISYFGAEDPVLRSKTMFWITIDIMLGSASNFSNLQECVF